MVHVVSPTVLSHPIPPEERYLPGVTLGPRVNFIFDVELSGAPPIMLRSLVTRPLCEATCYEVPGDSRTAPYEALVTGNQKCEHRTTRQSFTMSGETD